MITLPAMMSQQSLRSLCFLTSSNEYSFPPAISEKDTYSDRWIGCIVLRSGARCGCLLELAIPTTVSLPGAAAPAGAD